METIDRKYLYNLELLIVDLDSALNNEFFDDEDTLTQHMKKQLRSVRNRLVLKQKKLIQKYLDENNR